MIETEKGVASAGNIARGGIMMRQISRRKAIQGAALVGVAALGFPKWMWSAAEEGGEVIPWSDIPEGFNPAPATGGRSLDTRTFQKSSFITPTEDFFAVQHYGPIQVDPATYKLRVTGLVNKPMELTLAELKRRPRVEQIVGFECSGNNPARLNTLAGNARWAGTSLNALLKEAGLKSTAREVVFFAADKGTEEITHGGSPSQKYEQHFGRSLVVEDATKPEILLAWEMNGAPIPDSHGAPIRLINPGWYGVANVKWLNQIHAQDTRFMGRFMARDYVTLMERKVGDESVWEETSVARMRLKSMVARLTRNGNKYAITGFVLNDGTPLRSVEVRVDDGQWQPAAIDKSATQYSWKLFTYEWTGLKAGDHTIVSRATDANGTTQPESAELQTKATRWENNGQFVRKFKV
jgi:DMSO/TMAO reductase YedYZ molybdopterin-dependent catalytic subunit